MDHRLGRQFSQNMGSSPFCMTWTAARGLVLRRRELERTTWVENHTDLGGRCVLQFLPLPEPGQLLTIFTWKELGVFWEFGQGSC